MAERSAVLTLHALDVTGEAGLVTDVGVLRELGCRARPAATCFWLPGQGRPAGVEPVPAPLLSSQIEAATATGRPDAIRIGALADPAQVDLVASLLARGAAGQAILAPVLRWNGADVSDASTRERIDREVLPLCRLLLVRVRDLREWTGREAEGLEGLKSAAADLRERGARAVLLSGGASRGRVLDYLDDDGETAWLDAPRIQAPWLDGLSDAHAAALTAFLAGGLGPLEAARAAQRFIGFRLARVR
jgi:hydroxymethylpyrimidine/phosphomethylpyrimidine kinase